MQTCFPHQEEINYSLTDAQNLHIISYLQLTNVAK